MVCFAAGGLFVDSVDFRAWLIASRLGLVRLIAGGSGAFLGDFGGLRWVFGFWLWVSVVVWCFLGAFVLCGLI